jgi:hypothetical protein
MIQKSNWFILLLILLNLTIYAKDSSEKDSNPENHDKSIHDSLKMVENKRNINRFSLSCGLGLSYGISGIAASYDFAKRWGADLSIGLIRSPVGLTIRHNFFIDRYPLVISPQISFFNTNSIAEKNLYFAPGIGLGVDFRSYINRSFFINNTVGIGYLNYDWERQTGEIYLNTGLAVGFTFGDENPEHIWIRDELVSSADLSGLNLVAGLIGAIVGFSMLMMYDFTFGIRDLY